MLPLALSFALSAFSQAFVQDGIYYEVNSVSDKTLNLIWGGDCKGDVVLPESVTYNGVVYKISNIDDRAFSGCSAMTSIVIPEGVVGIGDEAFSGCTGLESISFPNSIAEISRYFVSPFEDCTSLTSINNYTTITYDYFHGKAWYDEKYNEWYNSLPDGIIRVGNVVVGYKGNLPDNKSIVIPDGVTHILSKAFYNNNDLVSVTIPSSVISIGKNAFYYCRDLSSIQVQGNLEKVGQNAFQGTAWYNDQPDGLIIVGNVAIGYKGDYSDPLIIPEGVTGIGDNAFMNYGFSAISLPSSLKRLGEHALSYNDNLSSVSLPQGLEKIGICAFYDCDGLESIVIPEGVTTIGSGCFQVCNNLSEVIIPNSIKCIKDDVFSNCVKLTSITIPQGLVSIGEDAFEKCNSLSSVNIPESLLRIGQRAFEDCRSLISISIPKGVESISERAFNGCYGLNSIVLSEGVKQIGFAAFSGCTGIKSLEIPASVEKIENSFAGIGNLNSIVVSAGNKFYDSRDNCNALIETATGTLLLGSSSTVIPKSISSIGNSAFSYCNKLKEITIPDNITKIGTRAFNSCSGLESITIPNSVDSIGDQAFFNCANLTSLTVPESVKAIGDRCFSGCNKIRTLNWDTEYPLTKVFSRQSETNMDSLRCLIFGKGVKEIENNLISSMRFMNPHLETVIIQDGITRIGNFAFMYLKLSSINIPKSVKEIGNGAFYHCTSLTDVSISNGVNSIGKESFSYCSSLTSITIPESVSTIEKNAFYGCEELTKVLIKGETQIGENAFFDCPNIENVFCTNTTPGAMSFHDPLIGGGDPDTFRPSYYVYELFDSTLMRTVSKVTSQTIEITMNNVPKGKYRVSVGILPNLEDSMPNSMHPVIKGYTDSMEEVLFDSARTEKDGRGRIRTTPYLISNEEKFKYETIIVDGLEVEKCVWCEYDSVLILDTLVIDKDYNGLKITLSSITGSYLLLDRVFLETIEGGPAATGYGPFSESVFKNATLYVPEGAVDAYRAADGWKLFKNIAVDPTVYPDQEVEVSISAAGYATFYNSLGSYRLPQGLSAMVVSGISGDKLVYETIASGADNGVVPAGVPVILMSDSKRAGTFKLQLEYGSYEYDGSNLLYGTDEDTQTYADGNRRFYKLAYGPKGTDLKDVVGWYWGAANGAAFSIEAHKAWLALPMSKSKDKMSFSLSGDPTYVLDIDVSGQEQETIVHDLQGRSISAPTGPGAYIINGKTVIITE